ncbi:MAG: glycoside hydrolase family 65 protein, partial [Clostridia bacterium]|nr:glycoside hydrolase family 65 protein [Clostridia bacterium]
MFNYNIKAVIIDCCTAEQYAANVTAFLQKLKAHGAKTVVYGPCANDIKDNFDMCVENVAFADVPQTIRMPLFHCTMFSHRAEFINEAAAAEYKTVGIYNDTLHGVAWQYAGSLEDIHVVTFLETGRIKPYTVDENAFVEDEIDPGDISHLESVFALGNGYLGLRGTYDERDESLHQESGMHINGIFESEPFHHLWDCNGFARNEQYTINLPDWRITEIYIDGEIAVTSKLVNHLRRLDMLGGKIDRSFEFESSTGKKVRVQSCRIVNMKKVHGAEIQYTVTPVNFDGEIVIKSTVVKNTPINGKITTKTVDEKCGDNSFSVTVQTERTKMSTACTVVHTMSGAEYTTCVDNSDNEYTLCVTVDAKQGSSFTIDKFAAFYADVDNVADIQKSAYDEAVENSASGFEYFAQEQRKFWTDHWKNADIVIDGNSGDQQAIRLSLFHLRQQLPSVNNASIGATGLTGANYSGKVFWDTEMYLMPYYLYTEPESVKGLLMYRNKILDKARERAAQLGGVGALFSWCSIDGEETSVVFEASTAEYHINSDIAYAIWRYLRVTGDSEFVYNNCAEMLFETARFMAHRGTFVEAYDGRFCINSVCGPDEYACGVNNNCYTNFMVQFHLRFAVEMYNEMSKNAPGLLADIAAKTGVDDKELDLWQRAADKMYYRINERYGIYEQDDRFVYNDAVDMEMIPKNFDIRHMFHPLDLWRIQVLKQADVVLLTFIMGDKFSLEEKKANFDYYEPKTNHGSSLSATIHAIMACE